MIANKIAELQEQLDRAREVQDFIKSKTHKYSDYNLEFAMSPNCHDFKVYLDDVESGRDSGAFSHYRYYTESVLLRDLKLNYQGGMYGVDADDIESGRYCAMQLVRRFNWDLQNSGLVQSEVDTIARMVANPGFK